MKPKAQQEIVTLYGSADERERDLAKTKAVKHPPAPEPRASYLREVVAHLRRYLKEYPGDPFNTRIDIEADHLDALREEIKKAWQTQTHPFSSRRPLMPSACAGCGVASANGALCERCRRDLAAGKRQREYNQRPDVKARQREYMREYKHRPDAKARKREYMREYNQRPDAKARKREYMREYKQRVTKLRRQAAKGNDAAHA